MSQTLSGLPRGAASKILKAVRADQLSLADLTLVHEHAFEGESFDLEDENHVILDTAIKESTERLTEASRVSKLDAARDYLATVGVDSTLVAESTLLSVADSLLTVKPGEENEVEVLIRDEETMTLVTQDGEVVGVLDSPAGGTEKHKILEWLGTRLTGLDAKASGIEAEKKVWLDRISSIYDPQINKLRRIEAFLKKGYEPLGESYLKELIAAHKGKTAPRSAKVGLLVLQYTSTRESTAVDDPKLAVATLKEFLTEEEIEAAIKVEESVLVSQLPFEVKEALGPDSGIAFVPGGDDKFGFK